MGPVEYSKEELQLLRAINIIFEICHISIALFIVHNIYKYVIGLKMKQPLIWLFYLLLLAFSISNLIDAAYSIRYPEKTVQYFG